MAVIQLLRGKNLNEVFSVLCAPDNMTLSVILRGYNPGASLTPHCDTFEYDIIRAPTGFIFRAKPFSAFFAVK